MTSFAWKKLFDNVLGTPPGCHHPVWKCLLGAVPWIAVASIVTFYMHHWGWLRGFENTALDSLLRFWTVKPEHVVVVNISDSDYKTIFSSTSPLSPQKIQEVIEAVATAKPEVIVVDVDTAPDVFQSVKPRLDGTTKVIWAVDAEVQEGSGEHSGGHGAAPDFRPYKVLGRSVNLDDKSVGISVFPLDADGIIRRYRRRFSVVGEEQTESVSASHEGGATTPTQGGHEGDARTQQQSEASNPHEHHNAEMSSISWAAVQAYAKPGALCPDVEHHDEAIFSFAGGEKYIPTVSVGDLLKMKDGAGWTAIAQGKVVILGGAFRSARDHYVTPAGPTYGVNLVAQAIEADLQCLAIHPVDHTIMTTIEVIVGIIFAFLNCRFPARLGMGLGFLLMTTIAGSLSFLTFRTLSWWADFIPVLVAVQIHSIVDHVKEDAEMKKELEHCKTHHGLGIDDHKS